MIKQIPNQNLTVVHPMMHLFRFDEMMSDHTRYDIGLTVIDVLVNGFAET